MSIAYKGFKRNNYPPKNPKCFVTYLNKYVKIFKNSRSYEKKKLVPLKQNVSISRGDCLSKKGVFRKNDTLAYYIAFSCF